MKFVNKKNFNVCFRLAVFPKLKHCSKILANKSDCSDTREVQVHSCSYNSEIQVNLFRVLVATFIIIFDNTRFI